MWSELTDESAQPFKHVTVGCNREGGEKSNQEQSVLRVRKWIGTSCKNTYRGRGKNTFLVPQKQDMCTKGLMIVHMETYDPVLTLSVNNHRVMLELESSPVLTPQPPCF